MIPNLNTKKATRMLMWGTLVYASVFAAAQLAEQPAVKPDAPPSIIEITYVNGVVATKEMFLQKLSQHGQFDPSDKWLAGEVIAGDLGRHVLISLHPNFADLKNWHARVQAALHDSGAQALLLNSSVYKFDPSLSYNSQRVGWNDAGAFSLSYMFLRRGGITEFMQEQRLATNLLERAKVSEETFLSYALAYGDKAPAYVFVAPLKNLTDLDIDLSHIHNSLFTPEQLQHRGVVLRQTVESGSIDLMLVRQDLSRR